MGCLIFSEKLNGYNIEYSRVMILKQPHQTSYCPEVLQINENELTV